MNKNTDIIYSKVKPVYNQMGIRTFQCRLTNKRVSYFDGRHVYIKIADINSQIVSHFHEMGHAICSLGFVRARNKTFLWIADLISETIAYRFERKALSEYNKINKRNNIKLGNVIVSISDPHFLAFYISIIPFPVWVRKFYKI